MITFYIFQKSVAAGLSLLLVTIPLDIAIAIMAVVVFALLLALLVYGVVMAVKYREEIRAAASEGANNLQKFIIDFWNGNDLVWGR